MSIANRIVRNAGTLFRNPAMAAAYARWLAGRLQNEMTVATHFNARLGGFENFSNYWGTICKIPSTAQFDFVGSILKDQNAVCLDIGANIGSFAVILGKRFPACRIHAFEPAPITFRILQSNLDLNGLKNVQPHRIAVADRNGTVFFSNEPSLSQRNHIVSNPETRIATCEIPSTSLDSFCEAKEIERIGFMKVDCEGVEPLVLQGAKRMLRERRIAALLVEVCPRNLHEYGYSIDDISKAMTDVPYTFHRFTEEGVGQPISISEMSAIRSEDVLFLPPQLASK